LAAYRTASAVIGAFAKITPERMMAADEGGNALITSAGKNHDGNDWVFTDIHLASWGGRQDRDGVDGTCGVCISTSNTPFEIVELEYPVRIQHYGFVRDACGAGKFRGGLAVVRQYQVLADDVMIQVRSDRAKVPPYGLYGGQPGTLSKNILNPGPDQE